jgi:hypothetical protein
MHAFARRLLLLAGVELVSMATPSAVRAQQPAPTPSPEPLRPDDSGDLVWAHVAETDAAQLQEYQRDRGAWTTLCTGSCDAGLDAGAYYRVTGSGIRESASFRLSGASGSHITLEVKAGSKVRAAVGIALVPTGILAMASGVALVLIGGMDEGGGSDPLGEPPAYNTLAVPGWTTFGLGAAALIGGIVLIATNASTSVIQQSASPQTGLLLPVVGWRLVPTWREAMPEEKALPPVVGMPLWTGRF